MNVIYTRTQSFVINPRILEEYFDIENGENLTKEQMSQMFSEIPACDLIELCDIYSIQNEIEN